MDELDTLTPKQRRWIIGLLRTRSVLDEPAGENVHLLGTIQERFRLYDKRGKSEGDGHA